MVTCTCTSDFAICSCATLIVPYGYQPFSDSHKLVITSNSVILYSTNISCLKVELENTIKSKKMDGSLYRIENTACSCTLKENMLYLSI